MPNKSSGKDIKRTKPLAATIWLANVKTQSKIRTMIENYIGPMAITMLFYNI